MNEHRQQAAIQAAMSNRQATKAVEHLMGLVSGMVADRSLHDLEIKMLSTWMADNPDVVQRWPGFVIAKAVGEVMADGVITEAERTHLLEVLTELSGNDFALSGAAAPDVASLPINDSVTVELVNAGVCHTGAFIYGTRAAVERLTLKAGGMPLDNVTKQADLLVVGTRVSRDWVHTSFGRKIQKAAELQEAGHPIEIISERRWIEVISKASQKV